MKEENTPVNKDFSCYKDARQEGPLRVDEKSCQIWLRSSFAVSERLSKSFFPTEHDASFCMLIQVETENLRVILRVRPAPTRVRQSLVRVLCPTERTRSAGTEQRSPGSKSPDWRRSSIGKTTCPGREDASSQLL